MWWIKVSNEQLIRCSFNMLFIWIVRLTPDRSFASFYGESLKNYVFGELIKQRHWTKLQATWNWAWNPYPFGGRRSVGNYTSNHRQQKKSKNCGHKTELRKLDLAIIASHCQNDPNHFAHLLRCICKFCKNLEYLHFRQTNIIRIIDHNGFVVPHYFSSWPLSSKLQCEWAMQ